MRTIEWDYYDGMYLLYIEDRMIQSFTKDEVDALIFKGSVYLQDMELEDKK